jgi:hypothetical protein
MEDIMIVPLEQTDLSKVSMMAVHKSLPIIFIPKIPENLFWVVEELVEYNIEHFRGFPPFQFTNYYM